MKKRITAVALVVLLLLAGCQKGKVEKKRGCKGTKPCEILVVSDSGKERWVKVDKNTFDQCAVHEWYEDGGCMKPSMRNIPVDENGDEPLPEINRPRRDPKRDERDRNARLVIFRATVSPTHRVEITWSAARGGDVTYTTVGKWRHEIHANVGTVVTLRVISGRFTDRPHMLCSIHQSTGRGLREIDAWLGTTNDCFASGRVI